MNVLQAENVTKRFGPQVALNAATLSLERGEIHGLVGVNGAGKSTLAWLLAGRFDDYEGRVSVDGREAEVTSRAASAAAGIQIASQEPALVPGMTVFENVALGSGLPGRGLGLVSRQRQRAATTKLFETFDIAVSPDTPARELTLEESQLIDVLRAYASNPKVLILDEPPLAGGMAGPALRRVLSAGKANGMAVLLISHWIGETIAIADRLSVVRNGVVVNTTAARDLTVESVRERMAGTIHAPMEKETVASPQDEAATFLDLCLLGTGRREVARLRLRDRRLHGLVSHPAEAASSLCRAFAGLERPGQFRLAIRHDGDDMGGHDDAPHALYVSRDRESEGIFPKLSAATNVTISSLDLCKRFGLVSRRRQRQVAEERLANTGFDVTRLDEPAWAFSGGNQQKLLLARASMSGAPVILFDEPNRGVDVESLSALGSRLRSIASPKRWVLLVSTEMEFLQAACDEIHELDVPASSAPSDT